MAQKKSTMIPMDQRKNLIEKESAELSLCKQCELLNISRSSLYYTPSVVSSLELEILKNISISLKNKKYRYLCKHPIKPILYP